MTKDIFIIGGGHAGSSAAIAAARARKDLNAPDVTIHLIDKNPFQTIKPRMYEYELEDAIVPYDTFLKPLNVVFHQDLVEGVDLDQKIIHGDLKDYSFDRLVICLGSEVKKIPGTFNVDSYQESFKLRKELQNFVRICSEGHKELKIAIVGAGFTGYEVACEMPINIRKAAADEEVSVPQYLISLFDGREVGSSLGKNPEPFIITALDNAEVRRVSNAHVKINANHSLSWQQDGATHHQDFDLIITTTGQRPSPILKNVALEQDEKGRLIVNNLLQCVDHEDVYAAGDVVAVYVDPEHLALMSCQEGRPQGRFAGYNAVASLVGQKQVKYSQPNYVTCLDLGDSGAIYTEGWDRKVVEVGGVAKATKRHINRDRIYPPTTGNPEDLYEAGELEFKTPLETQS